MILISHRGNIAGRIPEAENRIDYIEDAIILGYEVEIDVWKKDGSLWLGHDEPQYTVTHEWLKSRSRKLWIHTKDFESLSELIDVQLRIFYHEKEQHTIIHGTNLIWSHNLSEASKKSVIPLLSEEDINQNQHLIGKVHAVCSDYVNLLKS